VRAFIVTAGLVLSSMPALADSTYTSECYYEGPRLVCEAERKTARGTTKSECVREDGRLECTASHKARPRPEPERPVRPPTQTMSPAGVIIMRGMP